MTNPERRLPALTIETIAIADPGPLAELLSDTQSDGAGPLLWRKRGFGISGHGEALRLAFSGSDRMADAASAWRELVANAKVSDPLGMPGTGLVAFGAFTFSDRSRQSSVLIVPLMVVGRSGANFWLTRISSNDSVAAESVAELSAAEVPQPVAAGARFGVEFEPGSMTPDDYRLAVEAAVTRIRSGELSKVVIARDLVGNAPADADLRHAIASLAESYPDCWTFAIDGFVGSSPETLVSVRGGTVTARVLAGSAARGVDANSDVDAASALAISAKDQDEHEFAVQNVLSSLRRHSPGVTASETPFTLKLPNLWHLASDVEGSLVDGSSSLDLLSSLHPTAAVAGTPTADAVRLISELEPSDRGRYAGPVGWVGADGDGEWAIALRCAQLAQDGRVTAWAGAGIVADSDPEHELVETRLKFRPVIDAFAPETE